MTTSNEPHVLPSGATVVLWDVGQVTERYRRPITRLSAQLHASGVGKALADARAAEEAGEPAVPVSLDPAALDLMSALNDAVAAAMTASWSYAFPVSVDAMLDLPGEDYEALRTLTAPYVVPLLPSFAPTPDPESPTAPSQP